MNEKCIGHVPEALTFDDISLLPDYSEVLPNDTNVETRITRGIPMRIPFVSAAMDTVTEADLAISIARKGASASFTGTWPSSARRRKSVK